MVHDKNLIDNLYEEALREAAAIVTKHVHLPGSIDPVVTTNRNTKIITNAHQKWQHRKQSNKTKQLKRLKPNCVLVTHRCNTGDLSVIQNFDYVYSIVGDHLSSKPSRHCSYICDVTDSKFVTNKNTLIYFGALTDKTKVCQRIWTAGDIRSYLSIDKTIYQKYFDPLNGMIPTIVGAALLHAREQHPERELVIYGTDIHDLPPVDQRIINDLNVILCE